MGYYGTASASVGLQAGAQSTAIVFLFMTANALDVFRSSEGWSAGADADSGRYESDPTQDAVAGKIVAADIYPSFGNREGIRRCRPTPGRSIELCCEVSRV